MIGQTLAHYEISELLGKGGMGEVYRARDSKLQRDVAIKILPPNLSDDPERSARFAREARTLASFQHPNVASIYGFEDVDGTRFLVMELVEGEDLAHRLKSGALPIQDAMNIASQIAQGLEDAHEKGIIHRDLKPANVRVTRDGTVKILDFGLARAMTADSVEQDLSNSPTITEGMSRTGVILGTAAYMSPEQARGQELDRRTDIWSFGCVLYELLTGQAPFKGRTVTDVIAEIMKSEPSWDDLPKDTPRHVHTLMWRCLKKDPRERLRDIGEARFYLSTPEPFPTTGRAAVRAAPNGMTKRRAAAIAPLLVVASFGAGWLLRTAPPAMPPPRVMQLTFSGTDHQPVTSPDGKLIAFTSSRNGVSQIWLRQVVGGGEQPLTDGPDWRPRFSPDGASVAFIRRDTNASSAYRVPLVGGQARKLLENVIEVEWSPDGRRLAFLRLSPRSAELSRTALGIFDPESGSETILTEVEAWDLFGLSWSPDGARLATTRSSQMAGAGDWRLVIVGVEEGSVEEITFPDAALISAPTWADANAILFAKSSSTVSGSPAPNPIMRYDVRSGEQTLLLWERDLFPLRHSLTESTRISVLGDDRLVFDTHPQTQTVHVLDLSTGARSAVLAGMSTDRQPAYSPDGERVILTSNRTGNVDLFSFEPASGRLRQLTDHPGSDWDGAFTPDGESILWSSDRGGNLEIWMADADGSNPRQVSHDGVDAENPTMTADGEWIVYASGNAAHQGIFKIRPDGTDATHLVAGTWVNPEVSPDGRYVLFVDTDARLVNEVHVAEVATGKMIDFEIVIRFPPQAPNITYGRGRWLPDGSAIAYVGLDEDGRPAILVQDFAPGRDTRASRRPLTSHGTLVVESFGISPGGDRVAISSIRPMPSVKLAEGLPPLR